MNTQVAQGSNNTKTDRDQHGGRQERQ